MTDPPSTPERPPRPKRGAFPARKAQIDEAQPYVPDVDEPGESVDGEEAPPAAEGEAEH